MHYCEWCGYAHETLFHELAIKYTLEKLGRYWRDPYCNSDVLFMDAVHSLVLACAQICSGVLEE